VPRELGHSLIRVASSGFRPLIDQYACDATVSWPLIVESASKTPWWMF
jgi:hypothetical protein